MLLITNHPESDDNDDDHFPLRPLVALCDSAGPGTAFMSVSFVSLLSGEQVSKVAIWLLFWNGTNSLFTICDFLCFYSPSGALWKSMTPLWQHTIFLHSEFLFAGNISKEILEIFNSVQTLKRLHTADKRENGLPWTNVNSDNFQLIRIPSLGQLPPTNPQPCF